MKKGGRDETVMWHARGEDKCAQGFVKKGNEESAQTSQVQMGQ